MGRRFHCLKENRRRANVSGLGEATRLNGDRDTQFDSRVRIRLSGQPRIHGSSATSGSVKRGDLGVVRLLREDLSPERISGRLRLEGRLHISYESIYRFIRRDRTRGGKLFRLLRQPAKWRKRHPGADKRGRLAASVTSASVLLPLISARRSATGRWTRSSAPSIVIAWSASLNGSPAASCLASCAHARLQPSIGGFSN